MQQHNFFRNYNFTFVTEVTPRLKKYELAGFDAETTTEKCY